MARSLSEDVQVLIKSAILRPRRRPQYNNEFDDGEVTLESWVIVHTCQDQE